jgi:hypothetical protein
VAPTVTAVLPLLPLTAIATQALHAYAHANRGFCDAL